MLVSGRASLPFEGNKEKVLEKVLILAFDPF